MVYYKTYISTVYIRAQLTNQIELTGISMLQETSSSAIADKQSRVYVLALRGFSATTQRLVIITKHK